MTPSRRSALVVAAVAVLLGPGGALSQSSDEGGLRFILDVSTGGRVHDNRGLDPSTDDGTARKNTRLSFGLRSQTRTQRLEAFFGGTVRFEEDRTDGFSSGFEDPYARFSFAQEGANARFSFDASFNRAEVDGFALPEEGEVVTDISLLADDGFQDDFRLGAILELGTNAPLGFQFDVSHQATRYRNTTDPRLSDRRTNWAAATAILRFAPQSELRGELSYTRFEAEDAASTVRETRAGSLALRQDNELWQATASLGGREIADSVTGTRLEGEAVLSLTRTLPRGSVGAFLSTELTTAGQRSTAEVVRRFEMPNGALRFSLGAVVADTINPQTIGAVEYSHVLQQSHYSASLARAITVNDAAGFQRSTTGSLGADFELTEFASVAFGLDYTDIQDAGGGGVGDSARGSFSATYRRALPRDWTLSAGYQLRFLDEAGAAPAWDNAVFVTLDRTFEWLR